MQARPPFVQALAAKCIHAHAHDCFKPCLSQDPSLPAFVPQLSIIDLPEHSSVYTIIPFQSQWVSRHQEVGGSGKRADRGNRQA